MALRSFLPAARDARRELDAALEADWHLSQPPMLLDDPTKMEPEDEPLGVIIARITDERSMLALQPLQRVTDSSLTIARLQIQKHELEIELNDTVRMTSALRSENEALHGRRLLHKQRAEEQLAEYQASQSFVDKELRAARDAFRESRLRLKRLMNDAAEADAHTFVPRFQSAWAQERGRSSVAAQPSSAAQEPASTVSRPQTAPTPNAATPMQRPTVPTSPHRAMGSSVRLMTSPAPDRGDLESSFSHIVRLSAVMRKADSLFSLSSRRGADPLETAEDRRKSRIHDPRQLEQSYTADQLQIAREERVGRRKIRADALQQASLAYDRMVFLRGELEEREGISKVERRERVAAETFTTAGLLRARDADIMRLADSRLQASRQTRAQYAATHEPTANHDVATAILRAESNRQDENRREVSRDKWRKSQESRALLLQLPARIIGVESELRVVERQRAQAAARRDHAAGRIRVEDIELEQREDTLRRRLDSLRDYRDRVECLAAN